MQLYFVFKLRDSLFMEGSFGLDTLCLLLETVIELLKHGLIVLTVLGLLNLLLNQVMIKLHVKLL